MAKVRELPNRRAWKPCLVLRGDENEPQLLAATFVPAHKIDFAKPLSLEEQQRRAEALRHRREAEINRKAETEGSVLRTRPVTDHRR